MLYLDHNASTPMCQEAQDAIAVALSFCGNPSSTHCLGAALKQRIEEERTRMKELLGVGLQDDLVFTSGATEGNNMVLQGYARTFPGSTFLISKIEHPSVLNVARYLERTKQVQVVWLDVDRYGQVDISSYRQHFQRLGRGTVSLVSIMYVNHELGTIQDLPKLVNIAHMYGAAFHSDVTQVIGKMPLHMQTLGVDAATWSGHKFYGPTGIGGVFLRQNTKLEQLMFGGNQELWRRPGTENILGIVGMGAALAVVTQDLHQRPDHYRALKRYLLIEMYRQKIRFRVLGSPGSVIRQTAALELPQQDSKKLIAALSDRGICVSSGSACKAQSKGGSNVLAAIGFNQNNGMIRVGLGRSTTRTELRRFVTALKQILKESPTTVGGDV